MRNGWVYSLGLSLSAVLVGTAAAAPVVLNSSFEDNGPDSPYGPIDDWTQTPYPSGLGGFDYLSGPSTSSQFPWDNGTVPGEGLTGQVGFIQVYAGVSTLSLDQNVSGFVVGQTYTLSYVENARAGNTPTTEVLVNGTPVVLPHLDLPVGGSNPFHSVTSLPFVATATTEQVTLTVLQTTPNDDETATFDNVSIAPEPASLGVLALGGIGLSMRRRRI